MNTLALTDHLGNAVYINPNTVAYIRPNHEDTTYIQFSGAKENSIVVEQSIDEVLEAVGKL